jgi:hypothetical protein
MLRRLWWRLRVLLAERDEMYVTVKDEWVTRPERFS